MIHSSRIVTTITCCYPQWTRIWDQFCPSQQCSSAARPGSSCPQPEMNIFTMFVSIYTIDMSSHINDARVVLVQALEEVAELLYLEGGQRPSQVGDIQTRVNEGLLLGKKVRARPAPDESSTHLCKQCPC